MADGVINFSTALDNQKLEEQLEALKQEISAYEQQIAQLEKEQTAAIKEREAAYKGLQKAQAAYRASEEKAAQLEASEQPLIDQADAQEYAETVLEDIVAQVESEDIAIENESVLSAQPDELDGKDALTIQCVYEVEGYTVYMMQIVVSDEAFGTYIFTASYNEPEQEEALLEILNTITWAA